MLEARGAFAEAEPLRCRILDAYKRLLGPEHRVTLTAVNNLAVVLAKLGKFSEAPLRAASSHGRVAFLPWEKFGKNGRETTTTFSIHLKICHAHRRAIMHEHVNFTQIISNHYKFHYI